jgi:Glycosyl transferase family 2
MVIWAAVLVVLVLLWFWHWIRPKTCIVSTVKEPHQFQTWVKHNLKFVDRIYVFLDDATEQLKSWDPNLIVIRNWKDRLGFRWDDSKDEPANRNEKQRIAFEEGQRLAHRDGFRYIIHIDSDELLWGQRPSDVFSRYPGASVFHMKNEELAPDREDYVNCFTEGHKFHTDPKRYTAYGNGKAGGVVGQCEWHGPHFLKGGPSQEISPDELCVLHYPSCNIQETLKRARQYGIFKDNSAGWSGHHKETRDVLAGCNSDCESKARVQFRKRMADEGSKTIWVS